MSVKTLENRELFTPQAMMGALAETGTRVLPRSVSAIVCGYGYEISPRDLIGRVEIGGQSAFFFRIDKIHELFQKIVEFGGTAEAEYVKELIQKAVETRYQFVLPKGYIPMSSVYTPYLHGVGDLPLFDFSNESRLCELVLVEDVARIAGNLASRQGAMSVKRHPKSDEQMFTQIGLVIKAVTPDSFMPRGKTDPERQALCLELENVAQYDYIPNPPERFAEPFAILPPSTLQQAKPVIGDPGEFGPEIIEVAPEEPQAQAVEEEADCCFIACLKSALMCVLNFFCWLCDCYADEEQADGAQV